MHQIRLRPFDCCLPLCLKSDWALDQVLWVYDPFGYAPQDWNTPWTMAEDVLEEARDGEHIHRIDISNEVL